MSPLLLSLALLASACLHQAHAVNHVVATFVPAASPTVTTSTSTAAQHKAQFASPLGIANGYGLYPTALYAKKKAKPGSASSKIQVKMLKFVDGTGRVGDIVNVTPAFFNNKLRPTESAVRITDDEVAEMEKEAAEKQEQVICKASELKEKLEGMTLTIKRKAGPDGQLFGGIGPKAIMSEIQQVLNDEYMEKKNVKIAELVGENGKKMRGDIKHVGDDFGVKIALAKDISAKVPIQIKAEE